VALKQIIRKAREEGDVDTETEAQQRLTSLTMESSQVSQAEAQRQAYMQQVALQQQQAAQQAAMQQAQPQRQAPQELDPRVEDWVEKNSWYGRDTVMTHAAWGIHRQLIEVEGVDPNSDTYYDELDRRIRDAFPKRFAQSGTTRNVQQTVAPASRSTGINQAARRTVKLTPSQVAIAKKLGVPLEEYAKYVKE
jgi:phage I-like protein